MAEFNPKRARAKRPCPLWVDAFQRDTQHLAADEVGAYMLILMAMWTRETCDFPDDDRRLAAVSRVSTRLWKSRIGPVIREFLTAENGSLVSQRLRKEAAYTERQCTEQSNRKKGEKTPKALKRNKQASTADISTDATTDIPAEQPTQLPNYPTVEDTDVSSSPNLKKRKTRIPENAVISEAQIRAATKRGHSIPEAEAQFEKFKNDALAKGKLFLDWDRAFVTWLDSEYFRPVYPKHTSTPGGDHDNRDSTSRTNPVDYLDDPQLRSIARAAAAFEA